MFGKITHISDNIAHIKLMEDSVIATDLINLHIMF